MRRFIRAASVLLALGLFGGNVVIAADLPACNQSDDPDGEPPSDPVLKVMGEAETVFDWTTDRCERSHIPDLPAVAFRNAAGQVQLITNHATNYRLVGPELNNLEPDCTPVLESDYDPDPSMFNDAEWISGIYTVDGETIYALVHNEYQGHTHQGQCPSDNRQACQDTSITMAVSRDGGETFSHIAQPPNHLVATTPYTYDESDTPSGVRSPSNIIRAEDGYFYAFADVIENRSRDQWVCLLRTDDLSNPDAWHFWTPDGFTGEFVDPYREDVDDPGAHQCNPFKFQALGAASTIDIVYHPGLDRYILVGTTAGHIDGREVWGIYYSLSEDLINWQPRRLLKELPLPWTVENAGSDLSYLYSSLLDLESDSLNFRTINDTAYLYYTRNNYGHGSLDRDLIRVPVQVFDTKQAAQEATSGR